MRENAQAKGRRYLVEGRLVLTEIRPGLIRATCRGAGHVYSLGWTQGGGWRCDCAAKSACSHLHALKTVTVTAETP